MHRSPKTLAAFTALLKGADGTHGSGIMVVVAHPDEPASWLRATALAHKELRPDQR